MMPFKRITTEKYLLKLYGELLHYASNTPSRGVSITKQSPTSSQKITRSSVLKNIEKKASSNGSR